MLRLRFRAVGMHRGGRPEPLGPLRAAAATHHHPSRVSLASRAASGEAARTARKRRQMMDGHDDPRPRPPPPPPISRNSKGGTGLELLDRRACRLGVDRGRRRRRASERPAAACAWDDDAATARAAKGRIIQPNKGGGAGRPAGGPARPGLFRMYWRPVAGAAGGFGMGAGLITTYPIAWIDAMDASSHKLQPWTWAPGAPPRLIDIHSTDNPPQTQPLHARTGQVSRTRHHG